MQLVFVVAAVAALFSLAACQSAPYYLSPLAVNEAGISATLNVRDDRFTVTPASNNVAPSATAINNLQQIEHVRPHFCRTLAFLPTSSQHHELTDSLLAACAVLSSLF